MAMCAVGAAVTRYCRLRDVDLAVALFFQVSGLRYRTQPVLSHLVIPCTRETDARALLRRAPPFFGLSEVYAILDAFSQPIKQVRLPLCLPGCIHRYSPNVIHCAPSHNSFAAPCLPNQPIGAGGSNVPFLERHGFRIAEAQIPRSSFCLTKRNVMAVGCS
jgi:hypothetical protein